MPVRELRGAWVGRVRLAACVSAVKSRYPWAPLLNQGNLHLRGLDGVAIVIDSHEDDSELVKCLAREPSIEESPPVCRQVALVEFLREEHWHLFLAV